MNNRLNCIIASFLITIMMVSKPLEGFDLNLIVDSIGKGIQMTRKHPVLTTLAATFAAYGIYSLLMPKKSIEVENVQALSVTFKAPQYDVQNRLYETLLAMNFQENNQKGLERSFDILQQLKLELELKQYESMSSIYETRNKLAALLESMNAYLSLADQKNSKDLYDAMLLNYALLVSFLYESNKTLIISYPTINKLE